MTLLSTFAGEYALARDLSKSYRLQFHWAIVALEKHLKRRVHLGDLADDLLNAWIDARLEAGLSRDTVRSQRGAILTLWREACELGKIQRLPGRVKKIRGTPPLPRAFEEGQLRSLVVAASGMPGTFRCGQNRAAVLRAFILLGYYSGLRPWSDLLCLEHESIGSDGTLIWIQSKTKWPIVRRLPEDCTAAVRALGTSGKVFIAGPKALYYWWQKLLDEVGFEGPPKWLRRSGATAVEKQQPGAAMGFLGHKTAGLAYKHYVDPRQIQSNSPTPPRIA